MAKIIQGKLTITFNDYNWVVKKYDNCNAFKNCIGKTQNMKAVDIVGVHNNKIVYLFEMKDYNASEEIKLNKWGNKVDNLTLDLSQKVKDTIIGILATKRNEDFRDEHLDLIVSKFNDNSEFKIIFWIDGNLFNYDSNFHLSIILANLKRKLSFLNSKVIVTNSQNAKIVNANHTYK